MKVNVSKRAVAIVFGLIALSTAIGPMLSPAEAQTKFLVSDSLPDFSKYRTVYECLAARKRLWLGSVVASAIWLDTASASLEPAAIPPHVSAQTKSCSEKFNAESVDIAQYRDWIKLFLFANRDADAAVVDRRRQTQVLDTASDAVNSRVEVLLDLVSLYSSVEPIRWNRIHGLVDQIVTMTPAPPRLTLLDAYARKFGLALQANDSTLATQTAHTYMDLMAELTEAETSSAEFRTNGSAVSAMRMLAYLNRDEIVDSLRKSTASYVALKKKHWHTAQPNDPESSWDAVRMNAPGSSLEFLGMRAPALTGEFWFSPDAPSKQAENAATQQFTDVIPVGGEPVGRIEPLARPSSGKVSLVVFLYGGCRRDVHTTDGKYGRPLRYGTCWRTYAAIRRLAEAFPELEITVASQTVGYVAQSRPLTPSEEAQVMRAWWLGFHRLPATLVVSTAETYRLEGYDRRLIDMSDPNGEAYLFGGARRTMANQLSYLVDTDGTIVHAGTLDRISEKQFRELLNVMMNRGQVK